MRSGRGGGTEDNMGTNSTRRTNQDKVFKFSGRTFYNGPTANGTAVVVVETSLVIANLGDRSTLWLNCFNYWRMTSLKCRLSPQDGSGYATSFMGYINTPIGSFTTPATVPEFIDLPYVVNIATQSAQPTFSVSRRDCIPKVGKWNAFNFTTNENSSVGVILNLIYSGTGDVGSHSYVNAEFTLEACVPVDSTLHLIRNLEYFKLKYGEDYVSDAYADKLLSCSLSDCLIPTPVHKRSMSNSTFAGSRNINYSEIKDLDTEEKTFVSVFKPEEKTSVIVNPARAVRLRP